MFASNEFLPSYDVEAQEVGFVPFKSVTPNKVINAEKVGQILKPEHLINKVTALKSDTGTGKTTLARELIKYLEYTNPSARSLIISRNRGVVSALAKNLNAVSYLDAKDNRALLSDAQRIAITTNSLPMLVRNGKFSVFDLVFVDESQSVHAAFGDKTFKYGLATKVYRVYEELLRTARTSLFADATLDYCTTALLDELGRPYNFIDNQHSASRREAYRYPDIETILQTWRHCITEAEEGCPVVSAWSDKSKAHAESETLVKMYGHNQILLVTSKRPFEKWLKNC